MPQQVTSTATGLFIASNDLGNVPDGALAQADNCVISKDGVVEQRRGLSVVVSKALSRIFPWKGYQIGWAASGVLSRSSDNGATWVDYSGTYAVPGVGKIRTADASGNLYFTSAAGPYRLDAFTGTPEPAGIPGGLDVQSVIGTAGGTAVAANTQVAYRVAWGKRDANGNLLLGAPSGRSVITNPGPISVAIGGIVRAGSTVTVTAAHTYSVGNVVTLAPGEANFAAGAKTVATVTGTTAFTYTEAGSAVASSVAQTFAGPTRDAVVTATIPQGLPTGAFWQAYRSPNSQLATVTPDDNLGLIYEGTPPTSKVTSQFSRTAATVTVTTTTDHGYQAGMIVRVPTAVQGSGVIVAVGGTSKAASSTDGVTWTSRTIPTGTYNAVAWNGTLFAAVGASVVATSTDGITWTARTIPAGAYTAVCWNGSKFCAVGTSVCATSPDGTTAWAAQTIPAGNYNAIAWSGTIFAATADDVGANSAASSTDGITWASRTLTAGGFTSLTAFGVLWDGVKFVACGRATFGLVDGVIWTSADGITWSSPTIVATGGSSGLFSITWSGILYVAVGFGGTSLASRSPNAASWVNVTVAATYASVFWDGMQFIAVGNSAACATSPDAITWTTRTVPSGNYFGVASSIPAFSAGEKTLSGAPTTTTITYAEPGVAGTVASTQTLVPITASFTDTIPPSFLGAALYTNPNQGTLAVSADRVSLAQDIAQFRGFMFYANITYASRAFLYLISVGGSGVVAGDTITVDGAAYTADAATESAANRTFIAYTSGTPAQNIANTAQSLIRILNRTLATTITARYMSGPDDVPGLIYLEESTLAVTMTLAFSRPTAWSIQSNKAPENRKNELRWSSSGLPDALPLLNAQSLGSLDKPITAIRATRDMLVIVKDDGIWRLTGWNGVWDIQPLDPTMGSPAPETLVAFENAVFGVLDSGVARLTESGVDMIGTPRIYSALEPLLAPAAEATLAATAFGLAYHSAHKYILWLPSAAGDTVAKQAYVYDSWTDTWVRWTPPTGVTGWKHGMLNLAGADDRLYMLDGTSVYAENKTLTASDLHDAASTAIPLVVKYCPKFGGNPGQLHHFQEVALIFRQVKFTSASVGFSTNISPNEETIPLSGANYGVDAAVGVQTTIRVLVPLEKSRGSQLNVKFSHSEANAQVQLQGISVVFRPGSTRVSR